MKEAKGKANMDSSAPDTVADAIAEEEQKVTFHKIEKSTQILSN